MFGEHERARQATVGFLANRQSVSLYAAAILHWEFFLGQTWSALVLRDRLIHPTPGRPRVFSQGDGSVEERLHGVYRR